MISKIIQKEKERQESYLDEDTAFVYAENQLQAEIDSHNQSLINLKEYLEEELEFYNGIIYPEKLMEYMKEIDLSQDSVLEGKITQLKEDIKELDKMIGIYQ